MQDPQLPKEHLVFLGRANSSFPHCASAESAAAEQMQKYWTSGVEKD